MDRVIKFRGKRVDNGEWVEGCLAIWGSETARKYSIMPLPPSPGITLCNYEVDPTTIGQLVPDLTDKYGKDAYEGDRLCYISEADSHIYGVIRFGKIPIINKHHHVGFYVEWENGNAWWYNDIGYWLSQMEICGNVHEEAT